MHAREIRGGMAASQRVAHWTACGGEIRRSRYRLAPLVCAVVILNLPSASLAGGHVPSPTPRPTSEGGTPPPTPSATPPCDLPTPMPQAATNPVRSGELVTLDGRASSGTISAARWTQLTGPRVTIANADSLVASFVAPPVATPTVVSFVLGLFSPCTPTILVANVEVTVLPPTGIALIAVEPESVITGQPAALNVRLHSDLPVTGVAHDLTLAPWLVIPAMADGQPQCAVPAELGATTVQFEFVPPACSAEACGIRVAIGGPAAIADGALLYSCTIFDVGGSVSSCDDYPYDCCQHPLACESASASGADGTPVPAQCVEGAVRIQYPEAAAEFVFTVEPPAPRVGDLVHLTVDTVPNFAGLIGIPVYSLFGTQPFFTGDVSPRHFTGPTRVTYELQAVQAGTAELSVGLTFETRLGCPGNDFFGFDGLTSEVFPLTIAAAACPGDCNADGRVSIDELITGVRMALGDTGLTACPAMDGNGTEGIQIDDLVAAVTAGLRGCAAAAAA
jgi:hypothetical protein